MMKLGVGMFAVHLSDMICSYASIQHFRAIFTKYCQKDNDCDVLLVFDFGSDWSSKTRVVCP